MLEGAEEEIVVDARRHGIVLVGPFLRAGLAAALGVAGFVVGWPATPVAVLLLGLAALSATTAVWRWDRTRVVLTTEKLFVVSGVAHRRASAVHLARIGTLELEQTMVGRMLGYGTLVAGGLEIEYVPHVRRVVGIAARLAGS